MATSFSPTRPDVERYRRLRAVGIDLSHKIVTTIPRQAFEEVANAIGVLRNGVLVLDSEDMTGVLADCCLYDWFENGKNLIQRYAETHPAAPGTDEGYVLNAYTQAKYRIVAVQSAVPDAGIHCLDVQSREELFVMDLGLSRTLRSAGAGLATRTIPLGEYWMTGGAGLPLHSNEAIQCAFRQIESQEPEPLDGVCGVAPVLVRACLASGVADHVAYETIEAQSRKPRIEPRFQFKRRRGRS